MRSRSRPLVRRDTISGCALGVVRACSSIRSVREPMKLGVTTQPSRAPVSRPMNSSLGLETSARPDPTISKMPISFVEPKRFLTPRSSRKVWNRSPSK
jgi:hypothetical protein